MALKSKNLNKLSASGIFLTLLFSLLGFYDFIWGHGKYSLLMTGTPTDGQVIDYYREQNCGRRSCYYVYTPVVEFYTKDVQRVEFQARTHRSRSLQLTLNQAVPVSYDINDPSQAILADEVRLNLRLYAWIVWIIFLLGSGIYLFRLKS